MKLLTRLEVVDFLIRLDQKSKEEGRKISIKIEKRSFFGPTIHYGVVQKIEDNLMSFILANDLDRKRIRTNSVAHMAVL